MNNLKISIQSYEIFRRAKQCHLKCSMSNAKGHRGHHHSDSFWSWNSVQTQWRWKEKRQFSVWKSQIVDDFHELFRIGDIFFLRDLIRTADCHQQVTVEWKDPPIEQGLGWNDHKKILTNCQVSEAISRLCRCGITWLNFTMIQVNPIVCSKNFQNAFFFRKSSCSIWLC